MTIVIALLLAAEPCKLAVELNTGDTAPCDGVEISEQDLDACHRFEDERDQLHIDIGRVRVDLEQVRADAAAAEAAAKAKLGACQDGWDACSARVEVPAVIEREVAAPWPARTWMIPVWIATGALVAVLVMQAAK